MSLSLAQAPTRGCHYKRLKIPHKLIWQTNIGTMSNNAKQEITLLLKNLKDGDKSTQD